MNPDPDNLPDLFDRASDLEGEAREGFIADVGRTDPAAAERLTRLLEASDSRPAFLESAHPVTPSELSEALARWSPGTSTEAPFDLPADSIPGLRLLRKIASGGSATVFEAEQAEPRRRVAVKLIHRGFSSDRARRQFQIEGEALGRMQHPAIGQVYAVGSTPDAQLPYLVMELVDEGRPLTAFAAGAALDIPARVALFRTICDAVHHAHQKGVIHRDLKPENILVDRAGHPKVIDFGVARLRLEETSTTGQTESGLILGTLAYMGPEQFSPGGRDLEVRSDVYSLGVVLYELLSGTLPVDLREATLHEMSRRVHEVIPVPLHRHNPTIPEELSCIAAKALEKPIAARYRSAAELSDDLRRWQRAEPVLAKAPTLGYHLRTFVRRNRGPVLAGTLLLLLLVTAVAVITPLYLSSKRTVGELIETKRREESERELRQRTETALDALREELDRFSQTGTSDVELGDIARGFVESLEATVGTTREEDRDRLLESAVETLRVLEERAPDRPELFKSFARTYQRLASLRGTSWDAPPEEVQAAEVAYRRAVELWSRVLDSDASDLEAQESMIDARSDWSQALRKLDRYDAAFDVASVAVELAERLEQDAPSLDSGARLATALWAQSDAVIFLDTPQIGVESSRRSVEISERLALAYPGRGRVLELLAWSKLRLAIWIHTQQGQVEVAEREYEEGLGALLEAFELEPRNLPFVRDFWIIAMNEIWMTVREKGIPAGKERHRLRIAQLEPHADFPAARAILWQFRFAQFSFAGDLPPAERAEFASFVRQLEDAFEADPTLERVLRSAHQFAAASLRDEPEAALVHTERLLALPGPGDPEILALHGEILSSAGRTQEAGGAFESALALLRARPSLDPEAQRLFERILAAQSGTPPPTDP